VLYFFLSYARDDDPNYVDRFFEDLSRTVRDLAGVDNHEPVGFLDHQSISVGQSWANELENALGTCRCFVALTSPRYFRREYCGREWYVFSERLAAYERRWQRPAPALLPIQWIPIQQPTSVAAVQRFDGDGDPMYENYGLRQMLELKRFRDSYRTFVFMLARRIVEVAGAHEVPASRSGPRLRDAENIFAMSSPSDGPPGRPRRASSVQFVVVAGTRTEMPPVRRQLEYYGPTAQSWAPFWPGLDKPIGDIAADVAADRLFEVAVSGVADLPERIIQAKQRSEVLILLVDPWYAALDPEGRGLAPFDAALSPTAAVLIATSSTDAETMGARENLWGNLVRQLPRTLDRRDRVMLRPQVPTAEQLAADLEEVLEVARNRLFRTAPVILGPGHRPRPMLEATAPTEDHGR
jgi:FxsC-like protein